MAQTRHSRTRLSSLIWNWFGAGVVRHGTQGSATCLNHARPSRWSDLSRKPPGRPQWPFNPPMR